ncbi:MAG: rRNA pseudouridine synthase [Candidatus Obscuribacterales bacterium]|nr:rRNA pseudouridine synthase [Candidatus Obscuribacterales bacterium]
MAESKSNSGSLRLNRALASTGAMSRRQADVAIEAGRVRVNGVVVTEFNRLIDPVRDKLSVDGKSLSFKKKIYIALNKPKGIVTTVADERGRETVVDLLPKTLSHLKPVGRLDKDSEGLLIMTNDGDVAYRLTHPSKDVWKKYQVTVRGIPPDSVFEQLEEGIELLDGITLPARITDIQDRTDRTSFHIAICEGRNRQIRRMCDEVGHPVIRLVRVAIGRLQLKPMGPGEWRYLSPKEIEWCCHL